MREANSFLPPPGGIFQDLACGLVSVARQVVAGFVSPMPTLAWGVK